MRPLVPFTDMPTLHYTQRIEAPLEQVFAFHADPYNLLKITPSHLNLVVTNREPVTMAEGAEITYRIIWMGLPLGWRTMIQEYDPPYMFVDVQVKGPYRKWHHTHTFAADGNGTIVTDQVNYELPMGFAGDLVAGRLVRRQLESIFAYRAQRLTQLFQADSLP